MILRRCAGKRAMRFSDGGLEAVVAARLGILSRNLSSYAAARKAP